MEQPLQPIDERTTDVYEPPRVESVLTADDLAREVQYAGATSTDGADSDS